MTIRAFYGADRRTSLSSALHIVHLRPRSILIEHGLVAYPFRAKKKLEAFASVERARAAFERECAKKLAEQYFEIEVLGPRHFVVPGGRTIDYRSSTEIRKDAPKRQRRTEVLTALVMKGNRVMVKGDLVLPTGKLVAADPMLTDDATPFPRKLAPGKYPVVLSMKDGAVAAASVIVAKGAPEIWKESYAHPVDTATSSFFDASGLGGFDDERFVARLIAPRAMNACHPIAKSGATVAVFRSGRGDGEYVTYFGLRGRDLVCVTTDFGL